MFGSFLLLTASAISLPGFSPESISTYFNNKFDQYKLTPQDPAGGVTVDLWIEPHGKVAACWIGRVIGNKDAAKAVCPIIVGMYFGPARDDLGQKAYSLISWTLYYGRRPKGSENAYEAFHTIPNAGDRDDELVVIDPKVTAKSYDKLLLVVGADGSARACGKSPHLGKDLFEKSCALAKAKTFAVRHADNGPPVAYVRSVLLVPPK